MPPCDIHVQLHACQDSNEAPCPATGGLTDGCVAPTKHTCTVMACPLPLSNQQHIMHRGSRGVLVTKEIIAGEME
eukprot:1144566-Pelagomonas_calceolata.AAC.2